MHRWILPAVAILLVSIAVPIARSSGPWTAAATRTERTLVFDTHHQLRPSSIYTPEENAEMAGQIDELQFLLDRRKWGELVRLVRFPESPNAGTQAPDFELVRTDGKKLALSALRGKIAVFMFAAMTSPPARMQVPRLEALQRAYPGEDVKFFLVYSREPHAGETGYPNYAYTSTFERKLAYAKELDALTTLPVAVDGIDEAVQTLYGGVPNSAWVVDREGTIVFRSTWADSKKLAQVVDRLLRFEQRVRS
jgi:thiol-disulfide isomerase/thioredoxin